MVAAPSFFPKHPKILKFMQFCEIRWNFMKCHEVWWNLPPELIFNDSEGSLDGRGWKPWYSYRNIKVSEPPRTTRIAPKQQINKIFLPNRIFHSKTGFSASGAKKISPERYVYVGFWAGAANVGFCSPRSFFGARNHKRVLFSRFYRIL